MVLALSTTRSPATDLGHLLRKHPDRHHAFHLTFGTAHVLFPEATPDRCTCALVVEVDPVALVRRRRGPSGEGGALDQYVNDRPYSASSFLSVALGDVFRSAMSGACRDRPELASQAWPFSVEIPAVPCRGGEALLRLLFEPLGYTLHVRPLPLDPAFPDWGASHLHDVRFEATLPLHRLLTHLYVLLPVLDNDKHYWVGDDEVEKLLRHGADWLPNHPARDLITRRYLKHRRDLVDDALEQLDVRDPEPSPDPDATPDPGPDAPGQPVAMAAEPPVPTPSLHRVRLETVATLLKSCGAKSVLDLGCGEGRLLRLLLAEPAFERITGMDVSHAALERASENLRLDRMAPARRDRLQLLHGSLLYRDERLAGYDAAALVEVIEHLDPPRLASCERIVFEFARPRTVVVTTPNREYNIRWESLSAGRFRHGDHRFEWSRDEFAAWARQVAEAHGYRVELQPLGPLDPEVGAPSQLAIFTR